MNHIAFLLDETGSMHHRKSDSVGAFNTFIGHQAADTRFTLVRFNSNKTDVAYRAEPISGVAPLGEDYIPAGLTPLYDAACKLIDGVEKKIAEEASLEAVKVVCVILTDGEENASREFTRDDLADRIGRLTAAGWEFIFLGAEMDAFRSGLSLGTSLGRTASYQRQYSGAMGQSVASNTAAFLAGTRPDTRFTAGQRAAMGDEHYKNYAGRDDGSGDDGDDGGDGAPDAQPKDAQPVKGLVDDIVL